jgi:hypothetical protein
MAAESSGTSPTVFLLIIPVLILFAVLGMMMWKNKGGAPWVGFLIGLLGLIGLAILAIANPSRLPPELHLEQPPSDGRPD